MGHRIAEWRKAAPDEVPTQREDTRITSRDIFGLPGSATSEEAMDIFRAKEDETLEATQVANANKVEEKDKKANDKYVHVVAGAALLDKKDELYALLVHADPNTSIDKA